MAPTDNSGTPKVSAGNKNETAMFAQFVNLEGIEWWWFVAPVFNVCLAMREALLDITDLTHVALWLGSSLFYAIIAVTWAAKQFQREDLVESIS